VSPFVIGDSSLLHEILVDTDECDSVTTRYIGDSLDLSAHHENSTLNVLTVEIVLASDAGLVVGSHDTDLLASGDSTSENTTKGVEAALVGGRNHLGDEDHEGTVSIAVFDGLATRIIDGALVEIGGTISLGLLWGGELHDNHLEEGVSGVDPFLEHALEEGLALQVLLVTLEDDVEVSHHLRVGLFVAFHDVAAEHDDGLHDELHEAAGELDVLTVSVLGSGVLGELLLLGVKVVVTPELYHKLLTVELELLGVDASKHCEGEGPAEEGRAEGNETHGGVDLLAFAHVFALVGRDDDVSGLNDTLEVLIHGLTVDLELEDSAIDLVDHEHGLDLLGKGLTEDSLSLDAHTFDVIDDDESTVSDTEGSGHLGREINVTR